MKRKQFMTKLLAGAMSAAMIVGSLPTTALAVTGSAVAADGTYSATAKTTAPDTADFTNYDVTVSLTVENGVFSAITVTPASGYADEESENEDYFGYAVNGRTKKGTTYIGFYSLVGKSATEDTISAWDTKTGATYTSEAIKSAAKSALAKATESISTTSLQSLIDEVKELNQNAYTTDSWTALQTALTSAESVMSTATTQAEITNVQTALESAKDALVEKTTYVMMNIPYNAFYEAEIGDANSVAVDAVTSATYNKTRTATLAGGSYHVNSDGSDITGVTFPVKITGDVDSILSSYTKITDDSSVTIKVTNRGNTSEMKYTGKDALFESASYSYYVLSETPTYYKTATVNSDGSLSFGAITDASTGKDATAETVSSVTAELLTDSQYGDYQLNISGLSSTIVKGTTTVYGAIVTTSKGYKYGMRHVENIWNTDSRNELAWSVGITTEAHGSPLASAHYKSMVGQTISSVTYYTNQGIYEISGLSIKVPTKVENYSLSVADATVTSGTTDVTLTGLPDDYSAVYTVSGLEDVKVTEGKLTYSTTTTPNPGSYKLTVSDSNGTYASVSANFTLTSDQVPVTWDSTNTKLVTDTTNGFTDDQKSNYLKNISSVTVNGVSYSATGKGSTTIINSDGTLDTTSTPLKDAKEGDAFTITVSATGYSKDYTFTYTVPTTTTDEYVYVYAGLTWEEYWASEGVYNATDTTSSTEIDSHNETDKGGFDAVTRATTNHGLHRGSYQCIATITGTSGKTYQVSYWTGSKQSQVLYLVGSDTGISYSGGTMTFSDGTTDKVASYKVTGLKYVPVKVKKTDYDTFKEKYSVVENGGTLVGGFSESSLNSYSLTANVTANTNGLKTATKNDDGTFSFSAKQTGTYSGLSGEQLKTATGITPVVQSTKVGTYGEFIRVDLTGDYGDLGAKMQAVTWTYYGTDSTYTNALQTYGTKFAADNWMHSKNGIQLGLTDSIRCQLPDGYDGTGYWKITVSALGYADYTYTFQATAENILDPVTDTAKLEAAIKEAQSKVSQTDLYTSGTLKDLQTALTAANTALTKRHNQTSIDDATTALKAAIDALKSQYILMNIPYDEFYSADVKNNTEKVDTFTSATYNKVRTASLAGGSYHKDSSGEEILGVTFPVKVTDETYTYLEKGSYTQITDASTLDITVTNRGTTSTTTYTGKEALFESDTYSYYILSEVPSYYKVISVNGSGTFSFGETQGTVQTLDAVEGKLLTKTSYGDYQLNLSGLRDTLTAKGTGSLKDADTVVYGVIVNTTDGTGYGMRHLENIWRVEQLAWCTGFTTSVHNCPTSSAHYKSMMGKTISSVTYYTNKGIYEVPLKTSVYVPIKFEGTVTVEDASVNDETTKVTLPTFPDAYEPVYTVTYDNTDDVLDGTSVDSTNGVLTLKDSASTAALKPGSYTLTVTDSRGVYAPLTASFTLTTDEVPAEYNETVDDPALVAADDATADELSTYLANISKVSVNDTKYNASGKNSLTVINKDGSLNLDAAQNGTNVFDTASNYKITVTATGYTKDYTFYYCPGLAAAIEQAETVTDTSIYTDETASAFTTALAAAKAALANTESKDAADEAMNALNTAYANLTKKTTESKETAIDVSALKAAIQSAQAVDTSLYTDETVSALNTALAAANAALAAQESQEAVDTATANLNAAIAALVKKPTTTETPSTSDTTTTETPSTTTETPSTTTTTTTTTTNPGSLIKEGTTGASASSVSLASDEATLKDAVLTDAEKALMEAGKNIYVWLEAKDISASVSKTDIYLVAKALPTNYRVGMYLDLELYKQIEGESAQTVTELNGKIKVSVKVPDSLKNTDASVVRTYQIIRIHDGKADVLSGTYDSSTSEFTFETDKFSTYALVYQDTAATTETTAAPTKTGDSNMAGLWMVLGCAAGAAALAAASKRKKERR